MRTTLQLIEDLQRIWVGERCPMMSGNLDDLHVGPEGTIVTLDAVIALAAAASNRATVFWSPGAGTRKLGPHGAPNSRLSGPSQGSDTLTALASLQSELDRSDVATVVCIDWNDDVLGRHGEPLQPAAELMHRMLLDPCLARRDHRFVLIDRTETPTAVTRNPAVVRYPVQLPNLEERYVFIDYFDRVVADDRFARVGDDATTELIARASNGLSLRRLLAHMGELARNGETLSPASIAPVKDEFLVAHSGGALRPLPALLNMADIAGSASVRVMLAEAQPDSALRHVLLVGPPGTGKTTLGAAIGTHLGLAAVALGQLRDQYVGASERLMQRMIDTVQGLAPVVLFVDEIDQHFADASGPAGDSGVSQRINARFWEFTGATATTNGVLVVGATNRPSALGTRGDDRFTVIPILHPDPAAAAQILCITAARLGWELATTTAEEVLRTRIGVFSGRTLSEIVMTAIALASRRREDRNLSEQALLAAFDETMVPSDIRREEFMALDAVNATRRRSFLPWNAARRLGEVYEPPHYLTPFVDERGDIDRAGIRARMSELERAGAGSRSW